LSDAQSFSFAAGALGRKESEPVHAVVDDVACAVLPQEKKEFRSCLAGKVQELYRGAGELLPYADTLYRSKRFAGKLGEKSGRVALWITHRT